MRVHLTLFFFISAAVFAGDAAPPKPIATLSSSHSNTFKTAWLAPEKQREKPEKDVNAWPALTKKAADDLRKFVRTPVHLPPAPGGWKGTPTKAGGMREIDVPGLGKREYFLAMPATYAPNRNWPLVISLHGAGGEGKGEYKWCWEKWHKTFPAMIACPSGQPPGAQWFHEQIPFVLAILADMRSNFPIDDDKLVVHGFSNGGNGAWFYGLNYPSLWSAVITRGGGAPSVHQFENLLNLPTFIVHGKADPVIPAKHDQEAAAKLKALGYPHIFKDLEGSHVPFQEQTNPEIVTWLDKQKRNPFPKKILLRGDNNSGTHCYWLSWPKAAGDINIAGELKEANRIEITATGVSELTVWLADEFVDLEKPVTVVCNGKTVFEGAVTRSGAALLEWLRQTCDRAAAPVAKITVKVE